MLSVSGRDDHRKCRCALSYFFYQTPLVPRPFFSIVPNNDPEPGTNYAERAEQGREGSKVCMISNDGQSQKITAHNCQVELVVRDLFAAECLSQPLRGSP